MAARTFLGIMLLREVTQQRFEIGACLAGGGRAHVRRPELNRPQATFSLQRGLYAGFIAS